jgi:hypothetical protein
VNNNPPVTSLVSGATAIVRLGEPSSLGSLFPAMARTVGSHELAP